MFSWWANRGSNPDVFQHRCLRPTRLPIPSLTLLAPQLRVCHSSVEAYMLLEPSDKQGQQPAAFHFGLPQLFLLELELCDFILVGGNLGFNVSV